MSAMPDRLVERQPLWRRLFAGDDDVDAVLGAQAIVGDPQQGVGVRRQVDPHRLRLLVDEVVDKAGVLVAEPIMILLPHMRREQVVQRGKRPPPRDFGCRLAPFGVLIDHRVDDVDERLVATEQAVPPCQ